ncbi:MAG TPA: hypothetical protein DEQ38_14280 [Elusimicrobia bacterium]|nr:MAG: hypothetical protein A2089_07010 [Elusimicrobia bacterium GWD2_63_28]HCC49264.1 hypothetical protein [Elusimicrobiota bacterium]
MKTNNLGPRAGKSQPALFDRDLLKPFEGVPTHSLYPEFIAVASGLKPVLRTYAIRLDRYAALKKLLAARRLFSERSDFRISSEDDTLLDPQGESAYVYISGSAALAARAKKCEEGILGRRKPSYSDSLEFSKLMGYPRCCFDFFLKFVTGRPPRPSHLAEYEALKNTGGTPSFYLNNLIRGDHYLVSHYPCSYRCGPSVNYARALLGEIRKVRPALAGKLARLLKCPVIKFPEKGSYVRLLGGRAAEGGAVRYRDCDGEAGLAARFAKGDSLRASESRIQIFKNGLPAGAYRRKNKDDGTVFIFE